VAFDVLVAAGLFSLSRRWRPALARLLVAVIAADAMATAVEALWWNLPRAPRADARALLLVAWLAPVFATLVLSAAVRRRRT